MLARPFERLEVILLENSSGNSLVTMKRLFSKNSKVLPLGPGRKSDRRGRTGPLAKSRSAIYEEGKLKVVQASWWQ
jgi:hypothetical protein